MMLTSQTKPILFPPPLEQGLSPPYGVSFSSAPALTAERTAQERAVPGGSAAVSPSAATQNSVSCALRASSRQQAAVAEDLRPFVSGVGSHSSARGQVTVS